MLKRLLNWLLQPAPCKHCRKAPQWSRYADVQHVLSCSCGASAHGTNRGDVLYSWEATHGR